MRGLKEEGNPYAGRYGKWDEWIVKNAPGSTAQDIYAWHRGEAPRGYKVLVTAVDKDGWVIPALDYLRAKSDPNSEISSSSCTYFLEAGGEIDANLLEDYRRGVASTKGAWTHEIPKWLAEAPPKLVQFYHDDVLAFGDPGSGEGIWEDELSAMLSPGASDIWRRYSFTGELLGETAPGGQWWQLYFTDFEEVFDRLGGESEVAYFAYQGFVVFWDSDTQVVLAVYDYDGNEQPKDTDFFGAGYDDPMYQPIPGGELPWIYKAQQRERNRR